MATILWVYAAVVLLAILAVLLAAPYLGIYGDHDPFSDDKIGKKGDQ